VITGFLIITSWGQKYMKNILMPMLCVCMLTGCLAHPRSAPFIVGKWETEEASGDLGRVHAVWKFTSDGRTRWVASILNGKEEMKDKGTYSLVGTNLHVRFDQFGLKDYSVVDLNEDILRLSINTRTNILEFRRMK
jgi:hypothetical protein